MSKTPEKTSVKKTAAKKTVVAKATTPKTPQKKIAAKTAAAASTAVKHAPTHEEISRKAYEYFVQRGHSHGDPHHDWARAERELGGES